MNRIAAALLLFFAAAALAPAQEARNPFTSTGIAPTHSILGTSSPFSSALFRFLEPLQKVLNDSLTAVTKSLKGSRSLGGLLLVLALSLAYGAFHAAGPGHGKTVVSSYFLANEARLPQVLLVGNLIAAVHAASALAVVLVLSFLVKGLFATGVDQANLQLQRISFAFVAAIGLFLLVQRLRGVSHHHGHGGHHDHEHSDEADGHTHDHGKRRLSGVRGLLAIALPAGMIPCPGAVAVIVFALSLHLFWVSVLSVVSMSLGMGMTISVAAMIVVLAKRGFLRLFSGRGGEDRSTTVRRAVEIAGAAVLFLFGSLLFIAQF